MQCFPAYSCVYPDHTDLGLRFSLDRKATDGCPVVERNPVLIRVRLE